MIQLFKRYLSNAKESNQIKQYQYQKNDGGVDYEAYKEIQTRGNKQKIDRVWVQKQEIEFLSKVISRYVLKPKFGICHGTRNGAEQKWFKKYLQTKVIGTEISDTASKFPDTIEWDFHLQNPDWINQADFIYSNSLDHSYDPQTALSHWMETLTPNGVCIIEHTSNHEPAKVSALDPFGVEKEYFPYVVLKWAKGKYSVVEMIESNIQKADEGGQVTFFVLQNN